VRRGKEFAQKCAVDQAHGEILVFSDVATLLESQGIQKIVANFADPTVGCVSSEDRFVDRQGQVSGEGVYVKYEMFLRRLESQVFSVVGLSGSFFAARREVCLKMAVDLQSDFNTLLNSLKLGFRGISDPQSLGYYENIADEKKEFQRKVRTIVRGMFVLKGNLSVFNPIEYGLFSWELFSHKLCRWLVPFFMIMLFISNGIISKVSNLYFILFISQCIFYGMAMLYMLKIIKLNNVKKNHILESIVNKIVKISYYLILVNAAIVVAWMKVLKGEKKVYWNPSRR
jgi:hypothetical protein